MPLFSIRPRNNVNPLKDWSSDRPTKSIANGPPSTHPPYVVHSDTLPSRQSNGHALDYSAYTPSRFYKSSTHRTPRRPRQSAASYLPQPSRENVGHLHLHFDSSAPVKKPSGHHQYQPHNPHHTPSTTTTTTTTAHVAAGSYVVDIVTNTNTNTNTNNTNTNTFNAPPPQKHEPYSIQHAIKLKAAALRRYLAVAAELGDLSVLKQIVSNHRDSLARVRRSRHVALVRLHDASTLTGLPPPNTAVAPPLHGQFRRPTPIRAHPSTTAVLRSAAHLPPSERSSPSPPPLHDKLSRVPRQSTPGRSSSPRKRSSNPPQPKGQGQGQQMRRAGGHPGRRVSPRARSTMRGRRAASVPHGNNGDSNRQQQYQQYRNEHHSVGPRHDADTVAEAASYGVNGRKRYGAIFSRKSSGRFRRLGGARSMLMRRLSSRGSAGDDSGPQQVAVIQGLETRANSFKISDDSAEKLNDDEMVEVSATVATATGVISDTLDKTTLDRLRTQPVDVIADLEAEAKRLQSEERELLAQLKASERVLDQRRDMHDKAMAILDQFYGSLPGWQQDPITQALFVETVDMTDAGLETERDLAEARHNLAQAYAALKEHGLALSALKSIGEQLGQFISGMERVQRVMVDQTVNQIQANNEDVHSMVRQLHKHLSKSTSCAQMALECATDAPRVEQMVQEIKGLNECFTQNFRDIVAMTDGTVDEKGISHCLQAAKTAVCEGKLAEKFVQEREKLIAEDVEAFEDLVEKFEEYVIMERMALVDLHHPSDDVKQ